MADWRMRIWRACRRLGRIVPAAAMDVVKPLGLEVVGFHLIIGDRPCGGDSAVVPKLAEVLHAHAEQRRTVKLGVAADVVISVRVELLALLVAPAFLGVVFALKVDSARLPVVPFTRD